MKDPLQTVKAAGHTKQAVMVDTEGPTSVLGWWSADGWWRGNVGRWAVKEDGHHLQPGRYM